MNNEKSAVLLIIVLITAVAVLYQFQTENRVNSETQKTTIVATSSNLSYFANKIGENRVKVHNIVPGGVCPGHYDLKPEDAEKVTQADLVLWNGFEPWLEDLLKNSGNENLERIKSPKGPWSVPSIAKKYVKKITSTLCEIHPKMRDAFENREQNLLNKINSVTENLKEKAKRENLTNLKVVSQKFQKGFVEWLGYEVVSTYPSPEQLSTNEALKIREKAKNGEIGIIASNYASGTSFGKEISSETRIEQAILINYPGTKNIESYTEMTKRNAKILFQREREFENKI